MLIFWPAGQTPTGKRCVYEPKGPSQRCKQLVCSKNRAILIVSGVAVFILVIALIASLARPSPGTASGPVSDQESCTTTAVPDDGHESKQLATNGEHFPWSDIRLPDNVLPVTYDLYMHPNLTTFQFNGSVKIGVQIAKATDFIVLHIKHLNYSAVRLTDKASQKTVKIVKVLEYIANEQLYIKTDTRLKEGAEFELSINFFSNLSDALVGFYKSSYRNSKGENR